MWYTKNAFVNKFHDYIIFVNILKYNKWMYNSFTPSVIKDLSSSNKPLSLQTTDYNNTYPAK
jgi:hypothetical protein